MKCLSLVPLAVFSMACSTGDASPATLGEPGDGTSSNAPSTEAGLPDVAGEQSSSSTPDGSGGAADGPTTDGADGALEAAVCDRHFPNCPSTPPSYGQTIAPIVMMQCAACHYAGNTLTRNSDYTTYQGVYRDRGSILNQLYACEMPPAPYPPLASDLRTTLLEWLECGAPNN